MMSKRYFLFPSIVSLINRSSCIYLFTSFQENIRVNTIAPNVSKKEEEDRNDDFIQNPPSVDYEACDESTPSFQIPVSVAPVSQIPPQPTTMKPPSRSTIPTISNEHMTQYLMPPLAIPPMPIETSPIQVH